MTRIDILQEIWQRWWRCLAPALILIPIQFIRAVVQRDIERLQWMGMAMINVLIGIFWIIQPYDPDEAGIKILSSTYSRWMTAGLVAGIIDFFYEIWRDRKVSAAQTFLMWLGIAAQSSLLCSILVIIDILSYMTMAAEGWRKNIVSLNLKFWFLAGAIDVAFAGIFDILGL